MIVKVNHCKQLNKEQKERIKDLVYYVHRCHDNKAIGNDAGLRDSMKQVDRLITELDIVEIKDWNNINSYG